MHKYGRTNHCQTGTVDLGLEENALRARGYSPAEIRPVFEHLEDWMRILGYPRKDIFAVTLAVHEAVNNAFRHGNRGDANKYVQVSFLLTSSEVLVEVQDQGNGFDPDQVADPLAKENLDRPGGRGLFLLRVYTNWVSFNPQGNRVTLCRRRSES